MTLLEQARKSLLKNKHLSVKEQKAVNDWFLKEYPKLEPAIGDWMSDFFRRDR